MAHDTLKRLSEASVGPVSVSPVFFFSLFRLLETVLIHFSVLLLFCFCFYFSHFVACFLSFLSCRALSCLSAVSRDLSLSLSLSHVSCLLLIPLCCTLEGQSPFVLRRSKTGTLGRVGRFLHPFVLAAFGSRQWPLSLFIHGKAKPTAGTSIRAVNWAKSLPCAWWLPKLKFITSLAGVSRRAWMDWIVEVWAGYDGDGKGKTAQCRQIS